MAMRMRVQKADLWVLIPLELGFCSTNLTLLTLQHSLFSLHRRRKKGKGSNRMADAIDVVLDRIEQQQQTTSVAGKRPRANTIADGLSWRGESLSAKDASSD